jgi:glutamate dehydrogenase (NADP+)
MSAKSLSVFMEGVRERNPGQPEFHQAVEEVASSLYPWYQLQTDYRDAKILERLTE